MRKKIKIGQLLADDYGGTQELSIGVVLDIDESSEYKYLVSFPDDEDTDWYMERGVLDMLNKFKKIEKECGDLNVD